MWKFIATLGKAKTIKIKAQNYVGRRIHTNQKLMTKDMRMMAKPEDGYAYLRTELSKAQQRLKTCKNGSYVKHVVPGHSPWYYLPDKLKYMTPWVWTHQRHRSMNQTQLCSENTFMTTLRETHMPNSPVQTSNVCATARQKSRQNPLSKTFYPTWDSQDYHNSITDWYMSETARRTWGHNMSKLMPESPPVELTSMINSWPVPNAIKLLSLR